MADEISGPPIRGEAGIAGLVPFGLDTTRPRHFRKGLGVVWENGDNLGYAWRILTRGVCDACSLGPRGLHDDVLPGVHLCSIRLKRLRDHTVGTFEPRDIADIGRLRRLSGDALRALGRIPYPFLYRPGDSGFARISWDEAVQYAGGMLRETPPDRTAWLATGEGLTNETFYALSKTARVLGTNNIDFCGHRGDTAGDPGLRASVGYGSATCSLDDWIGTDLLILWGTDLANDHPVSTKYLARAKGLGTRIVVIDTFLRDGLAADWIPTQLGSALFGTRLMDDFVQVKEGGEQALVHALLKLLIRWDGVDREFIQQATQGWDDLVAELEQRDLRELVASAGVTMSQIEWLAQLVGRAKHMVSVWSTGTTEGDLGSAIAALHLSQGAIGKPLTGLVPIRSRPGLQGGGECGVSPTTFPGGSAVSAGSAWRLEELWEHPVPDAPGLTTRAMMDAARAGDIDVLYTIGGGLSDDPALRNQALQSIRLRIHQATHLDPSALVEPGEAILLLPAQTRHEQRGGGTSTSVERRIRFSPEIPGHPVVGESRPAYEIPALVACAARPELKGALLYPSSQSIRDEIGKVVRHYVGIETLKKEGDWIQWGGPCLGAGGRFPNLPEGRARFVTPVHT